MRRMDKNGVQEGRMTAFAVLLLATLSFKGIGAAGIESLSTWKAAARTGLAAMLLFTATAHFTPIRHDLVKMIPPVFPAPMMLVYLTGMLEIVGAVGILIRRFRPAAGVCLVLLFAAILPANIHASQSGVGLSGQPPTPLPLRVPIQMLFIAIAWWSTRSEANSKTKRRVPVSNTPRSR